MWTTAGAQRPCRNQLGVAAWAADCTPDYMRFVVTAHLTARLTWHEGAWNGRVCGRPTLNAACMVHDHVRDSRKDDVEEAHHGEPFAKVREVTGYLPPCSRDANAFGEGSYVIRHDDPLESSQR